MVMEEKVGKATTDEHSVSTVASMLAVSKERENLSRMEKIGFKLVSEKEVGPDFSSRPAFSSLVQDVKVDAPVYVETVGRALNV